MWGHMARIIGEVQPRYAFVENSPMLTTRGLGTVLGDLASMGFDAEWGVLSAADVGANHGRERIWIVGTNTKQPRFLSHSMYNRSRWGQQQSESIKETNGKNANAIKFGLQRCSENEGQSSERFGSSSWWSCEPNIQRVAHGVAARVDRLKAIGNGQVPLCAATAWNILKGRIDDKS